MTPGVKLRPVPEFVATEFLEFSPTSPFDGDDTLAWVTVPDDDDGSPLPGDAVMPVIAGPDLAPFPALAPAELVVVLRNPASRVDRLAVAEGLFGAAGVYV